MPPRSVYFEELDNLDVSSSFETRKANRVRLSVRHGFPENPGAAGIIPASVTRVARIINNKRLADPPPQFPRI